MATIGGGLNQSNFVSAFTSNPQLTQLTGGILPTGTDLTLNNLNPIQQWFAGALYDTYASLGGTAPGGLSGSSLETFQAYTQFYTVLTNLFFGPLLGTGGTTFFR